MTLTFYRILSERQTEHGPEPDAAGAAVDRSQPLSRRSYGVRERADCTLFVWRDPDGAAVMVQFLFGERFVEWRGSGGSGVWTAGQTDRARHGAGDRGRPKGVRTLHGTAGAMRARVRAEGGALLRDAALPPELADLAASISEV